MAAIIPTHSTGDYLSSADWNTVTALNTNVGLFDATGALVGTLPSRNAPNFLIQAGRVAVNPNLGNFSFNFPSAFPNGLLAVMMMPESAGQDTLNFSNTSTKTTCTGIWWRPAGTGLTATGVVLNFIAIGF